MHFDFMEMIFSCGLPFPFNASEDAAPIAGEELALVSAICIFDHAGGSGVGFVGEVTGLDKP
jgi:hypothetical protein